MLVARFQTDGCRGVPGNCDSHFNCEARQYDRGDCAPGGSCEETTGDGKRIDCDGNCMFFNPRVGTCDSDTSFLGNFNCIEFNFDDGDCSCDDVVCTAGTCKTPGTCSNGECSAETSAADGTACDDLDAGTDSDVCTGGVCTGVAPPPPAPLCEGVT